MLYNRRSFLSDFIHSTDAVDLGWGGNRFTWENRQNGRAFIKERLDRFLANKEWLDIFEDASVDHLNSEVSNHVPILRNTAGRETKAGRRPFWFLET